MSAGIVAAGHPSTAEAGAAVLRAGGNAVDAVVAACLASWVCEPLLTGPGAGGYLLVAGGDDDPVLLDFFVAAPGDGERCELSRTVVDFGDATQAFHFGAPSCGVPGTPVGLEAASRRWGTLPLADLAAPAAALARAGVPFNGVQAFITGLLADILVHTPEIARRFAPEGRLMREGDVFCDPELGAAIERFGAEGAAPFTTGDFAVATAAAVAEGGGTLTRDDLAGYEAIEREPANVSFRGRSLLTNPPPSAGGALLALAMARLDAGTRPPGLTDVVRAMEGAQSARTPDFDAGLSEAGFLERFLAANLGSTTHISVMDSDGLACAMTCTNGEGSGVMVPGTGIHLNNVMGEEDLNPTGFFTAPAGRRMPSMMSPTIVLGDHGPEVAVGSAGSNRIRSAILQTVVNIVDRKLGAQAAIDAPRIHFEAGVVYAEPGTDLDALRATGHDVVAFRSPNLFFGGVQAVHRSIDGHLDGGADPRRQGAVVVA